MESWKVRLLALFTVMALLASIAGPAMADDDCDFRERGNRDDVVVCRDDGDREVFEVEDFDYSLDYDYDFDEVEFVYYPFVYYPFVYGYDDCGYDWDGPVTPYDCFD